MTSSNLPSPPIPASVFIAYSQKDEALREELDVHLSTLKRQGRIQAWHVGAIAAGTEWEAETQQQLASARIILLLISPYFIASDACYNEQMQQALQRHEAKTARVIPIILKPCDWQGTPFSKLQVLPQDAKPITQWGDPDAAFLNVIQGIRQTLKSLPVFPSPSTPSSFDSAQDKLLHSSSSGSAHSKPQFSTYNPQTFTGRDTETTQLTNRLSSSCRVLAIVGITGIGKTALAERVIANLMNTGETNVRPYYRLSLDDRSLTPDLASSGAALLRTLGEEPTLEDQKDSATLLTHIYTRLCSHPCCVQIDSLERLLRGDEQEGWSEFCDPLWLDLLQQFLAGTHCPSQLLLTSQDIPGDLDTVASRYPQFWHCEPLHGLSSDEQRALFQKLGLGTSATDEDYLRRIGAFYDGHPLVLRVIADEIRQAPFQGNIARYWHHYEAEFTAASTPKTHKLSRSRLFRRRVRQRVEQSLQILPDAARQMLCASAVFRRPVPVAFWHAMLPEDANPQAAFDALQDRLLVEFDTVTDDTAPLLIRQHNLIRSVAYERLKANTDTWQQAERQAAYLWLTAYKPAPDAPNLETVRGYLEAFDHYCEVEDWEQASKIYTSQLVATNQALHWQLLIWGHYKELIEVSRRLVKRITSQTKRLYLNQIGNSYVHLGNIEKSIDYYQQALHFTRQTGDRFGEGITLGNLGNGYLSLGQYGQAIDSYHQSLTIAGEIGDVQGEGISLGNLGNIYDKLGQYEQAITFHQRCLGIVREIGDRLSEGATLGNLGLAHQSLGQYEQAIDFHRQNLTIAEEIDDRQGEGNALGNLGLVYENLGQYVLAINFHQQHLTIAREIGNRHGEGNALGNLGLAYGKLGQYERAIDLHQQKLIITQEIGDQEGQGIALGNLGDTYYSLGDYSKALDLQNQKLAIAIETGSSPSEGYALLGLGKVFIKLKRYPDASESLQNALEICEETGERSLNAEVLKHLAELHQALGEVEVARQHCQQALALATELGIPLQEECEALQLNIENEELKMENEKNGNS